MDDAVKTVRFTAIVACLLVAAAGVARGQGSLVILDPTISGNTVTLPIHLQGNVLDGVAALDFELSFDASILQPVQAQLGDAAANAGKQIDARLLPDGQYVVLMFGLERNAVVQGEVARIALNKLGDPEGGETPVTITNTKFATISGAEIPSQGSTTTLLFEPESGNGSGGAGGLPPTFGGGLPTGSNGSGQTSNTRNTQPSNTSTATTGTAKSGGGPAASALDLAQARAAADAQLSMLRGARAEREAARAAVERLPGEAGKGSGIRVRRDVRPSGAKTANRSGLPGIRADRRAVENDSAARKAAFDSGETAQREPGDQLDSVIAQAPPDSADSQGYGITIQGESGSNPTFSRGVRIRAGFLAGCLAIALGVFFLQRRWSR